MNYFEELNQIDVSSKTEKKNGLTYLSWAWAWGELKKRHPEAQYKVYEREDGCNYFTDGKTCWVKVSVTVPTYITLAKDIKPIEHIEYLPVMDYKNRSIMLDMVTSMDVNKAIQRALTKAIARHGLGLYIYAGEDIPEAIHKCSNCHKDIVPSNGLTVEQIVAGTTKTYGMPLCMECSMEAKRKKQEGKVGE